MASQEFQLSTYMRARLETWETDVNTTNNTSIVHACIKVWRTNSWTGRTWSSSVTRKIVIDGTTVCDWTGELEHYLSYGTITVAEGQKTVTHNNDGSKSVGVSCSLIDNVSSNYFEGSTSLTMDLTKIARHGNITNTSGNINDDSNPWIEFTNPASGTTQVWFELPDLTGTTRYAQRNSVGSRYTWSLTAAERDAIRSAMANVKSTKVRYKYANYVGGWVERNVDKTISINGGTPTFSNFTYKDNNSTTTNITGNNQILVQGKSLLQVTIPSANKAVANKKSSMSKYTASLSGISASANYSTSDLNINFSNNAFSPGAQTLSVQAIDSRSSSTAVNKNVNVLAYAKPVINATATRLNNFENSTTLVVKGTYSPLTVNGAAKNAISSVQYRYKQQSTSTWGSWTSMSGVSATSAGAYTTTNKVLDLNNGSAYDLEIKVTDKLETTIVSLVVSAGIPTFRIGTDGFIYNNEQPLMQSHVGQVIMSTTLNTAAKVKAIYGGTWEAWGKGRVPVGVDPNDSDFNAANKSGGAKTVTLTVEQMPAHAHKPNDWTIVMNKNYSYSGDLISKGNQGVASARTNANRNADDYISNMCGDSKPHSNMQPYQTLYMWRRTG